MKSKPFLKFSLSLLLIILPLFAAHYTLVKEDWKQEVILTYTFNFALGLLFILLFLFKEQLIRPYLGYYFLYFSLFKFIVFLTLIQPHLDKSGGVKGHAFASFFIPYAACLLQEVRFVIRELNNRD